MSPSSFLPVIQRCDNFRFEGSETSQFTEFKLTLDASHIIGLVSADVLDALRAHSTAQSYWEIRDKYNSPTGRPLIAFRPHLNTSGSRSEALRSVVESWRDSGLFSNQISPRLWRNELYTVYINAFDPRTHENTAFYLERTACALFGLVTYGVHMTMYTEDGRIWTPTRARNKQTWPLYLDNTVAGGIPHGLTPFESLLKECKEEANLDEEFVRKNVKPCGAVSYFFKSEKGYLQPEVQFVYDLLVPAGREEVHIPRPLDGEVESFLLDPVNSIIEKMQHGLFKPNCALVLVDFMIRRGRITAENEPYYLEIVTRLHGRFGYE